jgi:hypothetical protein
VSAVSLAAEMVAKALRDRGVALVDGFDAASHTWED